ncbi:MAG: flagellar brake domain-containing protein [Lachnospiraceae bacterium]|nr:flagellar brake domain-containing protein [Lachnospiraceae bacterium]
MSLSIGNKIELVKLDQIIRNDEIKKVYSSKICDIMPKNTLQISMPIYEGKIVPLNVDEKYSACFYTDKGLMQTNVIVSSRYRSGNLFFLEVVMLGKLEKVQRREFYRYKCIMNGRMRIVSDEEYQKGAAYDLSEKELIWNDMKIIDISGGGLKIVSKLDIEKNEIVMVDFKIAIFNAIHSFSIMARILSSNTISGHTGIYEQRLEFLKIDSEDRDIIIKFIFESERQKRAKESGLK